MKFKNQQNIYIVYNNNLILKSIDIDIINSKLIFKNPEIFVKSKNYEDSFSKG